MQVHSTFKTTIGLDDPETGALVNVRVNIKRLTLDEFADFKRDFQRSAHAPSDYLVARRLDVHEEAATHADGAFVLSDEQVRARRLAAMSPEDREGFDQQEDEEELFSRRFLAETISNYVTFAPDQVWDDSSGSNKAVVAGADIVRVFGGRAALLRQLLRAVMLENVLSETEKNALRSRSAFERSSSELQRAVAGERPAPIATAAEPAASKLTEGAPVEMTPSGPSMG